MKGARFELNERGIDQLVTQSARYGPRDRSTGGEIVGVSGPCWIVKWDNRKTKSTVSKNYITVLGMSRQKEL